MMRRLFAILSALSLLLCLSTCVLWICSYRLRPGVRRVAEHGGFSLEASHGVVGIVTYSNYVEWLGLPDEVRWILPSVTYGDPPWEQYSHASHFEFLGFSTGRIWLLDGPAETWAAFPCYAVVMLLGILPSLYLWRRRTAARLLLVGRCASCGYDLRATPDRCPECGAVPAGVSSVS